MTPAENTKETKIQLSLAAVMFFAPFVQHLLHQQKMALSSDDKTFVENYITYGYVTIGILIITIASYIIQYFINIPITERIGTIGVIVLIALLVIGAVGILANTSIVQHKKLIVQDVHTNGDSGQILLSFLPLYNIYLRYKLHNFDKPYRWAKESIIRWMLFIVIMITTNSMGLGSLVITIIIIRIATVMGGIDFINDKTKAILNHLFHKNPEEIRGYVSGTITRIIAAVRKKNISHQACIAIQKQHYQSLEVYKGNIGLYVEYGLGIALVVLYIIIRPPYFAPAAILYYLPVVLIIGRYSIMAVQWKHLPHLPLLYDIVQGTRKIVTRLSGKDTDA